MTRIYCNEIDPYAAQWTRNLMQAGLIPDGEVDERSIVDVRADDLSGFTQCHFFAGVAGWPLSFRMAGWPDDRRAWTASLPCQPYSSLSIHNGGPKGQADDRHLLPYFLSLVSQLEPPTIFGEQVAGAIKWGWLDEAFHSLEALGYACGAAIMRADAFGAAHERRRLYWVADASSEGRMVESREKAVSVAACKEKPADGDPLACARRALDGDFSDLLPGDGVSIEVERHALKGYGNAIVPRVAAEMISAFMECRP